MNFIADPSAKNASKPVNVTTIYLVAILYIKAPPTINAVAPTPPYINSGCSDKNLLNVSMFAITIWGD